MIEHLNLATERLTRWDYWIAEPATTNNRMALRSAIEAFRVIGAEGRPLSRRCSRATRSTS